MSIITIKMLANELHLSIATISKALRDSHEISVETKQRVFELAEKLNYVPNPYASSLRKRKSKTIAVVLPEVADSFFSFAINGIETIAQEKGYHVLIYLTHEKFTKEAAIIKDFQGGRVDGILLSVSSETKETSHIKELLSRNIPVVFFDRVCEDIPTAKIITDDFESGYKATRHLIERGCRYIALLSISNSLSITNKRMEGYKKALLDSKIKIRQSFIVPCTNDTDHNYTLVSNLMKRKIKPDGILATVEKLTPTIYLVCKDLHLRIPRDVKVVIFSNLQTASILNPSLTTIIQPAFEMGKAAATALFKALEKSNTDLEKESLVIP
ncbi:MAG: LacI family DNA-binding transcriptional regulator, partial [Chitinophagaceae bacterium]